MSESSAPSKTVLLRRGEVHSPADPFATAMVVERGQVAWVGSEGAADAFVDGVDEVIDLDGALVTPAFTDAHVHTTATGLALTGLDLSAAPSLEAALTLVRDFAASRPDDRVLLGHGWDAARWPGGRPRRVRSWTRPPGTGPSTSAGSTSTRRSSPRPCSTWFPTSPGRTDRSPPTPTTPYGPPRSRP